MLPANGPVNSILGPEGEGLCTFSNKQLSGGFWKFLRLKYISVYTYTMTFLNMVCLALQDAGVRYAIVGGYAVALHGAVRGTVDVDFVINWSQQSLARAEGALKGIGLVSRLPITAGDLFQFRQEYVDHRNLTAWNFHNPQDLSQQVDIIITFDLKGIRTKKVQTADGPVTILPVRKLIEMKRESGRPQDLEDVKALEKLQ